MSFLTCFCDLPQNEHLSSSPPSPNLATSSAPGLVGCAVSADGGDRAAVVGQRRGRR